MKEKPREQATREQLLDALMALVQEGAETPSLGAVAKRAGVSRMTLYRHFPGKEQLWESARQERGWEGEESVGIRERIMEGARAAFVAQGFTATMETIAKEAGVGVATVYRHFGDKEGLLQEFRHWLRPSRQLTDLALSSSEDVEADIRTFAVKVIRHLRSQQDIMVLAIREKLGGGHKALQGPSGVSQRELQKYFEEQIKTGRIRALDPGHLATSFMGLLVTFAWLAPMITSQPMLDEEEAGTFIAQLFVQGILP